MQVAYVGLGAMGRPMAANLAAAFDTLVWNRTGHVAEQHAVEHGSTAVSDLAGLAGADVVCTCLPTDAEVAAVAETLGPALRDGAVWIDFTSADPAGSRDVAATLAGFGVDYLDAPVSGGTDGAKAGTLTVMVGGDAAVLARVAHVLDVLASRVVHVGPVGAGMAVKAVNNAILAANLWAATEGFAALKAAGVPTATALEVVNTASGRSYVTDRLFPERIVNRAFPRTFALGLLAKDVSLALSVVAEHRLDAPVLELARALTDQAVDELGFEVDHAELVRVVEQATGLELT